MVERIAKRTGATRSRRGADARSICAPRRPATAPEDGAGAHVGYYLVDEGLAELERLTGYRPPLGERLHRWVLRHPNVVFVGGVVLAAPSPRSRPCSGSPGRTARAAWPLVLAARADPGQRHRA